MDIKEIFLYGLTTLLLLLSALLQVYKIIQVRRKKIELIDERYKDKTVFDLNNEYRLASAKLDLLIETEEKIKKILELQKKSKLYQSRETAEAELEKTKEQINQTTFDLCKIGEALNRTRALQKHQLIYPN